MPNIISKIKTPDNSVYDIKPTSNANINTDGVFYITSGGSTSAITGSLTSLTSYYEGLKIVLNYTLSSESSILVTLNINNLGPKLITRTSDLILEEGLKTGGIYHLVYNGKKFIMDGYVNTVSSNIDYANPVFGDTGVDTTSSSHVAPLLARTSISANELVYYDASLKGIATLSNTATSPYIFWDWGLAVCSSSYNLGDEIAANTLIQNGNILIVSTPVSTSASPHDVSLYVMFDTNNQVLQPNNIATNGNVFTPPFGWAGNTPKKGAFKTFIYIGTATGASSGRGYQVHLDLSNHDFITLSSESAVIPDPNAPVMTINPIFAINGRQVGGGNNTSGNYNNPVSGAGANPAAAVNISANDIVCYDSSVNGLVPLRAYLAGNPATSGIMYDWGLAFCTVAVSAGSTPPEGTLLQQVTFTTTSSAIEPVPIYAFFDSNGMPLQGYGSSPIIDNQNSKLKPYAPLVPNNKALTMIYVGTWESNKFHVDLSNHDFITYYNAPDMNTSPSVSGTIDNTKLVSHINGRPFFALMGGGGGSASLDGQGYGTCSNHTGGEVTPKRDGEGESAKTGDGEGESTKTGDNNAWTGLVTLSGYEAVANSVVAVYFPAGQAPQRGGYLNINNEGAYPMLLKGNTINLGDIESESIIVFIFDGSAYNVVAGYNKGDYEITTRKVQTISSNSTSLQYPSARCIYNIVGNIEAALQAI